MKIFLIVLNILLILSGMVNVALGTSILLSGDLIGLIPWLVGAVIIFLGVSGIRRAREEY